MLEHKPYPKNKQERAVYINYLNGFQLENNFFKLI